MKTEIVLQIAKILSGGFHFGCHRIHGRGSGRIDISQTAQRLVRYPQVDQKPRRQILILHYDVGFKPLVVRNIGQLLRRAAALSVILTFIKREHISDDGFCIVGLQVGVSAHGSKAPHAGTTLYDLPSEHFHILGSIFVALCDLFIARANSLHLRIMAGPAVALGNDFFSGTHGSGGLTLRFGHPFCIKRIREQGLLHKHRCEGCFTLAVERQRPVNRYSGNADVVGKRCNITLWFP